MGLKWYILVSMGRFPINVKGEGAVGIALNGDVQHCNFAFSLHFLRPLDVWMDAVNVCEKWIYVVFVDGCECIVCFSEPEEDDVRCLGVFASCVIIC